MSPKDMLMLIDSYLERNKAQRVMKSPEECLELLKDFTGIEEDKYFPGTGRGVSHLFRGHEDANYALETSLDRKGGRYKRRAENFLIQEFRRRMHLYFSSESITNSDLVILALMQHYGIPTRLLDVTRSPYVALYFAVRDALKDADAAVWVFDIVNIRSRSIRRVFSEDPQLGKQIGKFINPFIEFTRQELFAKWFMSDASLSHLGVEESLPQQEIILDFNPFRMNSRLVTQQGLFLASGSPCKTFEETLIDILQDIESQMGEGSFEPSVFKMIIPKNFRRPLLRYLEKMNITAASLFEGPVGFADSLREKLSIMDDHDFRGYMMGLPT